MAKNIGAGCRVYMGDAAAPHNAANGGSDANLDDVTPNLPEQNIASAMETADVTTLDVDASGFARRFIAALITNTTSGNYLEDDTGTLAFFTRLFNIRKGTNHPLGRGKVDMRIRPVGVGAGKPQLDFTAIFTGFGLNIAVATPLGGDASTQIDGEVALSAQS